MSGSTEDAAVAPAVEDADPQDQTASSKAKKTKWKKAPLVEFWEPPPYVPAGKGQAAQSSQVVHTGEKEGPKVGKADKGGRKGGGKGREKVRFRDDCGGKGKKGADGPVQNEKVESGPTLPPRGEGAYVPPRPAIAVGEEGFEDRFSMKGRHEGGKRGGRGFDGKGGKGGRFARDGAGCGRKNGSGKGRPYGSASDMQGTNIESNSPEAFAAVQGPVAAAELPGHANKGGTQPMPTRRMPSKAGAAAPMPAFCAAMPLGATVSPADGSGGKGVAAFPAAPMPFDAGYTAMPCYGNAAMPTTYAMPYFLMPGTVAGYPQVSAAATRGMAASGPSVAFPMSSQDGGAGLLPASMQGIPFFMPIAPDTSGDGDVNSKVMEQMEYYFSTENLLKDMYLRMQMNEEGWVPIGLIASFPNIRNLTTDQATMAEAIASSSTLELDLTKSKVRVKEEWAQWLLSR